MTEKTKRNIKIYNLIMIDLPQRAVSKLFGISPQAINEIYQRYADTYGGKPDRSEVLSPCTIPEYLSELLEAEATRLNIKKSDVLRIAINQHINRGESQIDEEILQRGGAYKFTGRVTISKEQKEAVNALRQNHGLSQSKAVRVILKNYQPICIENY